MRQPRRGRFTAIGRLPGCGDSPAARRLSVTTSEQQESRGAAQTAVEGDCFGAAVLPVTLADDVVRESARPVRIGLQRRADDILVPISNCLVARMSSSVSHQFAFVRS